jgi:pyridoxal phosphate enzyme (YggS family)
MTAQPDSLAGRLEAVRAGVAEAITDADRRSDEVTLIVVTKFHPQSMVRELHALGIRDFGENRHQDAAPKAAALRDLDLTWHFVGQLQSKKTRAVLEYARVIHSVDRPSVVDAINAATANESVSNESVSNATVSNESVSNATVSNATVSNVEAFIQLNLTDDSGRGGVAPADVESLAERVLESGRIRLAGLMAVAPLGVDPRVAFASVRAASDKVRSLAPQATALSMGMSGDYRAAILEGATHLRIGTAITGNRPNPG